MSVHDIQHYSAIKFLLKIPEDEPIFIIRGKDRCAFRAITQYAEIAAREESSPEFLKDCFSLAYEFRQWAHDNSERMKVPD